MEYYGVHVFGLRKRCINCTTFMALLLAAVVCLSVLLSVADCYYDTIGGLRSNDRMIFNNEH
jgi:hypothetical protein